MRRYLIYTGIFLFQLVLNANIAFANGFERTGPLTYMKYRTGILLNKWVPQSVDGLYDTETRKKYELPKHFTGIAAKRLDIQQVGNTCRINLKKNFPTSIVPYKKEGDNLRVPNTIHREDYLKFNCERAN